jgi:hypothetical protein
MNSSPALSNSASTVFLENRCCVKGAMRAGIADVEHHNRYAEFVESVNIDWHKTEGAIAVLQCEFRRAAQRCFANKWRRVGFDIKSHHIRSQRCFLNDGAARKRNRADE